MTPEATITLIVFGIFALLLIFEVPIAWCLAISGALGVVMLKTFAIGAGLLGSVPFQATSSYSFIVVPLYILLGTLVMKAGIAERVYALANRIFRRFPGGIGVATVAACAGFAAVSGSSVATAATIGKSSVLEMQRNGYKDSFATGIVGIAATLGILIPPSLVLIMYGIVSGESIARLFAAGVVPGILSAVVYAIAVMLMARRNVVASLAEELEASSAAAGSEAAGTSRMTITTTKAEAARAVGYIVLIFTTIMVGIFTGVMTTTESAAIAAVMAIVILFIENRKKNGRQRLRDFTDALAETAGVKSMAFAMLIGAAIFTFFLVTARLPHHAAEFLTSLDVPPLMIVVFILIAMIPLGMFLDSLAILVIVVPLTYPTLIGLGFDGVWYGILIVKMIEISLITPPVGLNAFVISAATGVRLDKVFRGLLPFVLVELIIVAILLFFPEITLFLPALVLD
ncbi:TRAP transporter large permease [Salinibacterium sp. ZJ77]|uniref:TRAP transporter large permease n=1 Tax=Salinibacterium sp. ZJ77 TaxID=2708337 RepID=UPI0014232E53|nr:TRAP transporter large permease [Salinibacterium sp. ZJ77]